MIAFAVWHEGLDEGAGTWVLAIDPVGERLLLADEEGAMAWWLQSECKLVKAATPDVPTLVMPVQMPTQQPSIVLADAVPNRAMRRSNN